jgi:pimeloyl-ACP methyl ester carboxylesterase
MSALQPLAGEPGPSHALTAVPGTGGTVHGTAALAARYADDLLLGAVRDVHHAVAGRVWGFVNAGTLGVGKPTQVVHDRISGAIYGGLGKGLRYSADVLDKHDKRGSGRRTEESRLGRDITSVVNGLIGDRLVGDAPGSAIRMAVREQGRDVPLTPDALAATYPDATEGLVVFLHGLMENDEWWDRRADELPWYGAGLAATGRWSPLRLRVNTGLSLKENGVALAALLDELVAAWPVPVRRIALVGHSMGGLVIHNACGVRTPAEQPWTELVSDIVTLGTPHLGAPLERLANFGAKALGIFPESSPFGRILETRSVGIADLRRGVVGEIVRPPRARYHLVSATLGATPLHPMSLSLGDLLVRHPSAMGRSGRIEMFPGASTLHLPNTDHFGLLNHPDVHQKLKEWLA